MAFYVQNGRSGHQLPKSSTDSDSTSSAPRVCYSSIDVRPSQAHSAGNSGDLQSSPSSSYSTMSRLELAGGLPPVEEGSSDGRTYRTDTTIAPSPAYKQIRYLNSATYIRPEHESFVGSETPRSPTDCDGNAGGDGPLSHRRRESGRVSRGQDCGDGDHSGRHRRQQHHPIGDAEGDAKQPADASIYMPTLDLDRNSWSSNDLTFTHRKGDEKNSKELIRKTEAFKEWLSAKMESEKYTKLQKRQQAQMQTASRQRQEEQLQQMREAKLKEWLDRKRLAEARRVEELRQQQLQTVERPTDSAESLKNYNAWLEKKLLYERAVRDQRRNEQERREQQELAKRQMAGAEYERWLETARDKPKPVPLNRGLLTLRGSISEMYVNPVPWDNSTDVQTM